MLAPHGWTELQRSAAGPSPPGALVGKTIPSTGTRLSPQGISSVAKGGERHAGGWGPPKAFRGPRRQERPAGRRWAAWLRVLCLSPGLREGTSHRASLDGPALPSFWAVLAGRSLEMHPSPQTHHKPTHLSGPPQVPPPPGGSRSAPPVSLGLALPRPALRPGSVCLTGWNPLGAPGHLYLLFCSPLEGVKGRPGQLGVLPGKDTKFTATWPSLDLVCVHTVG